MNPLFPRAINTCTGGKLWYVCTIGNFRGCCSSDPCTTGICPDDGDSDDSSGQSDLSLIAAVASKTTMAPGITLSPSTTAVTTDSSTTSVTPAGSVAPISPSRLVSSQTSTISDTSTAAETTGATALSSVLPASHVTALPSSTPSNTPSAASSNRGAIIGGVVGGVAALIICAILIFCCCRRKRKYGKRETFVAWYPYRSTRKDQAAESEMKDSSNAVPSDTTRSLVLNPGQVSHSSTTNLISTQNSLIPPTVPHSTELSASVPPRAGFTPELPDTELRRLRAELASHAQSELINVPLEQRRRQQNVFKARTGPRAWESPLPTPTATQGASPNREIESGSDHRRTDGGTPRRDLAGRVVTAEGVVLGANLDRYSNGTVIGDSQNQNRGDRERTGHGDASHVMSFMQYGVRSETRNTGAAAVGGGTAGARGNGGNTPESEPRSADRGLVDDIAAAEGDADVPPAYEAEESSPGQDLKSPSGRMSLSPRNA